jgi:hypothetical protein
MTFAIVASALAVASAGAPSPALAVHAAKPHVTTGKAKKITTTSALLTASILPEGETTYYFKYGTTTAYGLQTVPASAGSGATTVKVGQLVSRLQPGVTYFFKVVAQNASGRVVEGKPRSFATKGSKPKLTIPKRATDVYGSPYLLTGTLSGLGAAGQRIVLQANPFPYTEGFTEIGLPATANTFGRFSFRITNLLASTQLRVVAQTLVPTISSPMLLSLEPRVTFHARTSARSGLARLYGTVTPAIHPGTKVLFQIQKAIKPTGKSEATTRYVTLFRTVTRKATATYSRFSLVVKLRKSGRYRVVIQLPKGPLATGYGERTIVLHASAKKH